MLGDLCLSLPSAPESCHESQPDTAEQMNECVHKTRAQSGSVDVEDGKEEEEEGGMTPSFATHVWATVSRGVESGLGWC